MRMIVDVTAEEQDEEHLKEILKQPRIREYFESELGWAISDYLKGCVVSVDITTEEES